jgi:hypothetical protein
MFGLFGGGGSWWTWLIFGGIFIALIFALGGNRTPTV